MKRDLKIFFPEKKDAFSRISKFMSPEESGIVLSAVEEKILARWMYAYSCLTERKFGREEIVDKICGKFEDVSKFTARNDIDNTYKLFINITREYKQFTLWQTVEFIDKKISQWEGDKSLAPLIPKLLAEKTRALAAMPIDMRAPDIPAPIIIINTINEIKSPLDLKTAMMEADKLIAFEKELEDAEFEIMPDENTNTNKPA